MKRALTLVGVLALSACGVLPERTPVDLFELPDSSLRASASTPRLDSLRLVTPSTIDALGGTRLLVQVADHSYQAHPGVRWASPVPQLWRDWLLDAFWRDGRVDALSTSSDGLQATLELGGMLRALNHEYADGRSVAVIRFDARLVETASRRIIASRRFEVEEPVQGTEATNVVTAMGRAADALAAQLVPWTVEQGVAAASL
ncbi:MAG: membrane integrity-associated transporter subunit PqiC [Pseudomonadales bacterium]|nr:membrane integrity-associated transporter subunit PqiC [Pseudomonadales bacterium]MCP5356513.1 membrane integrity-associated transporter subunit PqiC [Pseudomonadales bacterium]